MASIFNSSAYFRFITCSPRNGLADKYFNIIKSALFRKRPFFYHYALYMKRLAPASRSEAPLRLLRRTAYRR